VLNSPPSSTSPPPEPPCLTWTFLTTACSEMCDVLAFLRLNHSHQFSFGTNRRSRRNSGRIEANNWVETETEMNGNHYLVLRKCLLGPILTVIKANIFDFKWFLRVIKSNHKIIDNSISNQNRKSLISQNDLKSKSKFIASDFKSWFQIIRFQIIPQNIAVSVSAS